MSYVVNGIEHVITTAYEEKAILHKVGAEFDTEDKKKKLYAYRLQELIANKILFSSLWQCPELLREIVKHVGLTGDKDAKFYLSKI